MYLRSGAFLNSGRSGSSLAITMISGSNIGIHGGTFNSTNIHQTNRTSRGIDMLMEWVATGAFHNSRELYDAPKFHPHTHIAVLEDIMQWVNESESAQEDFMLWLFGPAGAGKSAIAKRIAEIAAERDLLIAGFFFSRTSSTRNATDRLIPTLAYQLALSIPETRSYIEDAIERDPAIFNKNIPTQINTLLIKPLQSISSTKVLPSQKLIIIDGLDECKDRQAPVAILEAISRSFPQHKLPVIFLVASRPEPDVVTSFNCNEPLKDIHRRLALDDTYRQNPHFHFPTVPPPQMQSSTSRIPQNSPDTSCNPPSHIQSSPPSPKLTSLPMGNLNPDFQYSKCTGRRRALCIGINYRGQEKELRGCINDAKNVRKFLMRYHYKPQDIILLTDDTNDPRMLPTRHNILEAMHWLVRGAKPNDSLFLHYSGHGGQTRDLDGDEADGWDEVIYPLDFEKNGHIVDDQLHDIMVKPLPTGCRLTGLFDASHSGTILDLPYVYSSRGRLGNSPTARGARTLKASPADVISWSACKDDQTSADMIVDGIAVGAMTHTFITALTTKPEQTYIELLRSIRATLKEGYSQKPQLSSSHPIDTNLRFIV